MEPGTLWRYDTFDTQSFPTRSAAANPRLSTGRQLEKVLTVSSRPDYSSTIAHCRFQSWAFCISPQKGRVASMRRVQSGDPSGSADGF